MQEPGKDVAMIHYECLECSMTATCIFNDVAVRAWRDHMQGHALFEGYMAWTWDVTPLPFD